MSLNTLAPLVLHPPHRVRPLKSPPPYTSATPARPQEFHLELLFDKYD